MEIKKVTSRASELKWGHFHGSQHNTLNVMSFLSQQIFHVVVMLEMVYRWVLLGTILQG